MTPLAVNTLIAMGIAFVATIVTTRIATIVLRRRAILDTPNERSSHTVPTPRGGGWGLMVILLPAWFWATMRADRLTDPAELLLMMGAVALMAVSWIDDRRTLGALPRFAVQIASVGLAMAFLPNTLSLTGHLIPQFFDRLLAGLAWLWFVNLFNFMDGIDGITGGSAFAMGLGVTLIAILQGPYDLELFRGAMIAATALGFLVWNWQPAKVFMGDVGSVPLGYLLGYGLIRIAMDGRPAAALIVALYYLTDATITLIRRALKGERVWQAHRQHFYQRAVARGRTHAQVARRAIFVQLLLAVLGAASMRFGWWMLLPAALLVAWLLLWMSRTPKAAP